MPCLDGEGGREGEKDTREREMRGEEEYIFSSVVGAEMGGGFFLTGRGNKARGSHRASGNTF